MRNLFCIYEIKSGNYDFLTLNKQNFHCLGFCFKIVYDRDGSFLGFQKKAIVKWNKKTYIVVHKFHLGHLQNTPYLNKISKSPKQAWSVHC